MDFQLSRNLSALSRAQNVIAEALMHIDCLSDHLNREIIMSTTSSESRWWSELEQVSFRYRISWRHNQLKELDDLARPRSTSLPLAETAPPVHLRLMTLFLKVAIRGRLWRDDASREE